MFTEAGLASLTMPASMIVCPCMTMALKAVIWRPDGQSRASSPSRHGRIRFQLAGPLVLLHRPLVFQSHRNITVILLLKATRKTKLQARPAELHHDTN